MHDNSIFEKFPEEHYFFWVQGPTIGKGIDFHAFGIRNDIHSFGIKLIVKCLKGDLKHLIKS